MAVITPSGLLIILLLPHASLGSLRLAMLIFLAVPMAASDGIIPRYPREMRFSISASVGVIAAENLRKSGMPLNEISHATALARLPAHGPIDERWNRDATSAGNGGDRRSNHIHASHFLSDSLYPS